MKIIRALILSKLRSLCLHVTKYPAIIYLSEMLTSQGNSWVKSRKLKWGWFHRHFYCFLLFKSDWKYYKENPPSTLSQTRKSIKKNRMQEGKKQSLKVCDFLSALKTQKICSLNYSCLTFYLLRLCWLLRNRAFQVHSWSFQRFKIKIWQEVSLNTTAQLYSERKCSQQACTNQKIRKPESMWTETPLSLFEI